MTDLLQAYLDGSLTAEQAADLTDRLKRDPDRLRWFAEEMFFDNQLRLAVEADRPPAALDSFLPGEPPARMRRIPARRVWGFAAAAAALVAVLSALFAGYFRPGEVVRVSEVSGSLSWTGANGETRTLFAGGEDLPPGTFEILGANSRATLTFRDGTRVDLSGDSRTVIAARRQKLIRLQSGCLRAEVRPQPAGMPLLVRTPTARLEVAGTVFSLIAEPRSTTMNVQEGKVRMERLADGKTVDVPARHTAAASLETSAPLAATIAAEAPTSWHWDAAQPPPEESLKRWRPQDGCVGSVPIVVGTEPETGRILLQHGIRFDAVPALVHAAPDSVLRFRCRSARPAEIVVFLSTGFADGSFAGNFETVLPPGSGNPQEDGWREVALPVRDIPAIKPQYPLLSQGQEVNHLSLRSYHQDAGLEFSRISIDPR